MEPKEHSVQLAFRNAAARYGSRPAIGLAGNLQSFGETYERALRLASALETLGVAPGERVGIMASNGPWFLELYVAASELGVVELPINLRFTFDELVRFLAPRPPAVVLVTSDHAPLARDLQDRLPTIRRLVGIGDGHGLDADYDRLLRQANPTERPIRPAGELLLVSATSGTSGYAKAVAHTQATTAAGYAPLIERLDVDEHSHIVSGLAMYFAPAYSGWTMSFLAGARQTIMPAYDPVGYVELVEHVGGTHALLGPTPVYLIMDAGVDLRRLSGLRCLSMGGAACDPARLQALTEVLGARVTVQFGMTELAAGTVLRGEEMLDSSGRLNDAHRSVGRPVDGLDVRLGDGGEIELRGPTVTPGYLDNDEANAQAFRDGWFRTGDVASLDDEGNVYIVDRMKDLIVSGGINVAPLEIEQVIASHPGVLAAGVCGVRDDTYGEAVHAAVVPAPGVTITPDEVVAWCRDRLSSVKKPRSVTIVDALPISSTGKLLRRELRAQIEEPQEHQR